MLVIEALDGATVECAGALVACEQAAARRVRPELPAWSLWTFPACALAGMRRWPAPGWWTRDQKIRKKVSRRALSVQMR